MSHYSEVAAVMDYTCGVRCKAQPVDTLASSDGGDRYTGLDRFGRVIDRWWYDPSTSPTLDRFQFAYDRNSNALYENNLLR